MRLDFYGLSYEDENEINHWDTCLIYFHDMSIEIYNTTTHNWFSLRIIKL